MMTSHNFLRKKFLRNHHVVLTEFLTYLITYVSNYFLILFSSSLLRKASLVVVVGKRWFS